MDFSGFAVPPGTRRGVMPDRAAAAFVGAMERLAPLVEAELARLDRQRNAEAARDVVKDLRRALRGLARRLPQYELPSVSGTDEPVASPKDDGTAAPGTGGAEPPTGAEISGASVADDASGPVEPAQGELLPPGPLAGVRVSPDVVRVAPGSERRVRAVAHDAGGRSLRDVSFTWTFAAVPAGISLRGEGERPAVCVAPDVELGTEAELRVEASADGRAAAASARVLVADSPSADAAALGIPEPVLVSDAYGTWRSRMAGERWEINDAHEDYRALRNEPRARLRYLLALLGRELAARATGYDHAPALDALVEILAHAERNLRGR
jgi:hypothetical protein